MRKGVRPGPQPAPIDPIVRAPLKVRGQLPAQIQTPSGRMLHWVAAAEEVALSIWDWWLVVSATERLRAMWAGEVGIYRRASKAGQDSYRGRGVAFRMVSQDPRFVASVLGDVCLRLGTVGSRGGRRQRCRLEFVSNGTIHGINGQW